MNDIVYAGTTADKSHGKNYVIVIPDGGETAVVYPPRSGADQAGGLRVVLEKAMLAVRQVTEIKGGNAAELISAIRSAEKYYCAENDKKQLVLGALGELIAGYVTVFTSEKSFSPAVEAVRTEIIKNVPNCTFALDDVLKKMPLNYDYIRKTFKKETGVTPHEFLLNERMKLARSLILSGISNRYSRYSVSQLAEACGFSDPLYFSRVFKNYYGVSPRNYRVN